MKVSVCIDSVFGGMDPAEAVKKVRSIGIDTIEFWGWWDKDLDRLKDALDEYDMKVAAFCTKFISLVDPASHDAYYEALQGGIAAAKKLGAPILISQVGADRLIDREEQKNCLVEGLKRCAPLLEEAGVTLGVEPLNIRVDHKGYFLTSSDECAEIIERVGSRNIQMLFDIYHQQISEGDLISHIRQHKNMICHFHAAGNPGRNELYRSEVDYGQVFKAIAQTGYDGYIGLEYFSTDEPEKGLAYAKELLDACRQ